MDWQKKLTPERLAQVKQEIIDRFAKGEILKNISKDLNIEPHWVYYWRQNDPEFDAQASSAQNSGFEIQADGLLTIYDEEEDVNKARGKSDNLKWVLARRAASRYGDKMTLDVNNTIDLKGALSDARARLAKPIETQATQLPQAIESIKQLQSTATDSKSVEVESDPPILTIEDLIK